MDIGDDEATPEGSTPHEKAEGESAGRAVKLTVRTAYRIADTHLAELERAVGAGHVRTSPTPGRSGAAGDDVVFHVPADQVEAAECRAIRLCFVVRVAVEGKAGG